MRTRALVVSFVVWVGAALAACEGGGGEGAADLAAPDTVRADAAAPADVPGPTDLPPAPDLAGPDAGAPDAAPPDAAPPDAGAPVDRPFVLVRLQQLAVDGASPGSMTMAFVQATERPPDPRVIDGLLHADPFVAGDCAYHRPAGWPTLSFACDPECPLDERCVAEDVCYGAPAGVDAGTITVSGLLAGDLQFLAMGAPDWFYGRATDPPPAPWFDAGTAVTVASDGGALAPFSLGVGGVGVPTPALSCDLGLTAGAPVTLAWDPADETAEIVFQAVVAYHIGDSPYIECRSPDDGELVVPAAIVDRFLADLPADPWAANYTLARRRTATLDLPAVRVQAELWNQRVCWTIGSAVR